MTEVPACEVEGEFHLLIPSRFPPVPLYTRLGGEALQRAAEKVEAVTNPRLREQARLARSASPLESPHQLQNWNLAPFAYVNPAGSTFLSPNYRVLELVEGVRPAIAHAVRAREAFLASTDEPPIRVEMRLIIRPVKGRFADLSGVALDPDPEDRRRLGEQLYGSEFRGILFRRPELGLARAVSIFDGGVLGRAIQSDHYQFDWDGRAVTRIGKLSSDEVIERDTLFAQLARPAAA